MSDMQETASLQLGPSTVKYNRVQAEPVQERKRECEIIELVGQDSTSNPAYQLGSREFADY